MIAPSSLQNLTAAEMIARGTRPFAFQILLPGDWAVAKVNEAPLSTESPAFIAIFEDPDVANTSLQVLGMVLQQEISAANWLYHYFDLRGWSITEVEELGPRRARAVCTLDVASLPMTAVVTATVNGSTLTVLQGICPTSYFQTTKEILLLAVNSFSVIDVADPNVIEPWSTVKLKEDIQFQFPASWSTRRSNEVRAGRNAVDFMRKGSDQTVQGFIRVKSIDREYITTLEDALSASVKEFQDSGASFQQSVDAHDIEAFSPFQRVAVVESKVRTNPEHLLHFQSYALEYDAGVIVVSCLGPADSIDYYQWAINMRAFEIATVSINVHTQLYKEN